VLVELATALDDIPRAIHQAGAWACRTPSCEGHLQGAAGALRDATRELSDALVAFPDRPTEAAIVGVHHRAREGRRLARRGRAAALQTGDVRDALVGTTAIAALERALSSSQQAVKALQRLIA
jgi:hypothetical protein